MYSPTLDRRTFLKTVGGISGSLLLDPGAALGANPTGSHRRPNFLVVVADDQCFRTIRALNNGEVHTPNFDRLVARGTTFTHCFHQGSWTGAVCIASRAMLHTGRYLWTCGGNDCGNYPLLGETLQRAGYATYLTGKWHNGDRTALRSFGTGRTIGPGMYVSGPLAYGRPRAGDPWTPWDPKYRGHWTPRLWDIQHDHGKAKASRRYRLDEHSCPRYAETAVQFLKQTAAHPDQPFFLYVAWNSPHDPRQAPKEWVDRYPRDRIEVPPNFLPEHPFNQGDYYIRDEKLAPFPRTPAAVQLHRSEYYALLSYLDHQLGRILDALEATGQAENTYILITGDHGLAVGEHGLMGKQNLYDCSVRMPLLVIGPGIRAGRRIESLVYQHCLFPTICHWASVAPPRTIQFPALTPLFDETKSHLFDSVYCAYRHFQRMVRTDQYKLILYPEVKRVQLFDIQKDPWETKDLSTQSSRSATITHLFHELRHWQETVSDRLVLDPAAFGIKV